MNRSDLQKLASLRIKEAKTLLDNDHCEGAYYLAGYSVECALKSCIAKKTRRYDFPDKKLVNESYKHDLKALVKVAGLEDRLKEEIESNREFDKNWAVVKDWTEESRYKTAIMESLARDLYTAIVNKKNGVLPWLKKVW